MASFITPAAGVWLVPSRHGYKCTSPNYHLSNFLCLFQLQPPLQGCIYISFFSFHTASIQSPFDTSQGYWQSPHTVSTSS